MRLAIAAAVLLMAGAAPALDSAWVSYYNGADGWFAFQGPQRAMRIHPSDFGIAHPFQVESLKIWWYWGMGSRDDTVFTFRLYEGGGSSLLWESESLVAPSTNWTYYRLAQPVTIDSGDLWIATTHRLRSPWAHPYVNVDTGPTSHSYYGSPGAWVLDDVGEFCFFAFVRELGTGVGEGRWTARPPEAPSVRLCGDRLVLSGAASAPLVDLSGRTVMVLSCGDNGLGRVAPGVYFVGIGVTGHKVVLVH